MKKIILTLFILSPILMFGQVPSDRIEFYMDICRFYDFQINKSIVELYVGIDGKSIKYQKEEDGKFQASVNINWVLEKIENGDSTALMSDNYTLNLAKDLRPEDTSKTEKLIPLFHMQKIDLDPGTYLLRGIAYDMFAPVAKKIMAVHEFVVDEMKNDEIDFSDIKWVAKEEPNGDKRARTRDQLIPLVTGDFFFNKDTMTFYQEIYNAATLKDEKFYVRSRILQGDNILYAYDKTQQRIPAQSFRNAYKEEFIIDKLASNTYYLQVEILNARNKPLKVYRKKFFVANTRVSNEFDNIVYSSETDIFNEYTEEELTYYLRTLLHISTEQELNFIKALDNFEQKKNFLYSFFEKRLKEQTQPVRALWNGHLLALDYVNQEFKSTFREGWQTDRGRVFMKYGIPQDVERYPGEANLIPYEIWRYNRLDAQTNVIFIFYDQDLASNEYELLHSSKYGEINNPRWREQLINKGMVPGTIDYERDNTLQNRLNSKLDIDGGN